MFISSPPEVFSKKDAAQTRSKPTGEQPRRSVPENPKYTRRTPLPRRTPLGDCSCMSKEF